MFQTNFGYISMAIEMSIVSQFQVVENIVRVNLRVNFKLMLGAQFLIGRYNPKINLKTYSRTQIMIRLKIIKNHETIWERYTQD